MIHLAGYRLELFAPRSEQTDLLGSGEIDLLQPRAGALHNDSFKLSTLSEDGWKPYLRAPQGRRMTLNTRERTTDTGAMSCVLVDPMLGSDEAERWFLQYVANADDTSRLSNVLGRFHETLDGGCSFASFFTGRLEKLTKISRDEWQLDFRDLAEDFRREVFTGRPHSSIRATPGNPSFADITPLIPHHMMWPYGGFTSIDQAGGFPNSLVLGAKLADVGGLHRLQGSHSQFYARWQIIGADLAGRAAEYVKTTVQRHGITLSSAHPVDFFFDVGAVRVHVANTGASVQGDFWLRRIVAKTDNFHSIAFDYYLEPLNPGDEGYITWASFGAVFTPLWFFLYAPERLGGQTAVLVNDTHPVQMMAWICDGYFGPMHPDGSPLWPFRRDASNPIWASMIADVSFGKRRWIIREKAKADEFLAELCQESDLAYTIDADGYLVPIDMRPSTALTLPEITDDDLLAKPDAEGIGTSLQDAVTTVDVEFYADEWLTDFTPSRDQTEFPASPPGLIDSTTRTWREPPLGGDIAAATDLNRRVMTVKASGTRFSPGVILQTALGVITGITQSGEAATQRAKALAQSLLSQYLRGPKYVTLICRRTSVPSTTHVGALRAITASNLPSYHTLKYGDTIIGRCVERTEEQQRIRLVFEVAGVGDGGLPLQADPPTLGNPGVNSVQPNGVLISHNVSVNADAHAVEAWVALTETSVGVRPVDTDAAWIPAHLATSTATYIFGPYAGGKRIWTRARSNPALSGGAPFVPSDWVYPPGVGYVDTTAVMAITSAVVNNITADTGDLSWVGGTDGATIQILLHAGSSATFTDAEVIAQFVHPPRLFPLVGLTGSTQYRVGVRQVDPQGGAGTIASYLFSTSATLRVLQRPAGIDFVYWSSVQLQVFPSEVDFDIQVERAPDDGSGGAGVPGAPNTGSSSSFVIARSGEHYDPLPPDEAIWWYRARHVSLDTSGAVTNASARTGWRSTKARSPFGSTTSPSFPAVVPIPPVVSISHAIVSGTATVTLTLTDQQGRVDSVEFQTQVGAAPPSAWTPDASVPYSASAVVNPGELTIIRWRVIGFDVNGAANQTLLAGEEHFSDVTGAGLPAGVVNGDFMLWSPATSTWKPGQITTDSSGLVVTDSSGDVVTSFR